MIRRDRRTLIAIWTITVAGMILVWLPGALFGAEAECHPCKIEGVITNKKGETVERFKYQVWPGFPTKEKCDAEINGESFKLAMQDLQARADQLAVIGDEFKDAKASAECVQL